MASAQQDATASKRMKRVRTRENSHGTRIKAPLCGVICGIGLGLATLADLLWWLIPVLSGPDTDWMDGGVNVCLGGRFYRIVYQHKTRPLLSYVSPTVRRSPDHTSPTSDFCFCFSLRVTALGAVHLYSYQYSYGPVAGSQARRTRKQGS